MSSQFVALLTSRLVPFIFLVFFPIVHWPGSYGGPVHLFDLTSDHLLITSEYYDQWVWVSAFVLPLTTSLLIGLSATAMIPSIRAAYYDISVLLLSTWAVFLLVLPQAVSFGTDSKPMSFDVHPNWTVYMAITLPFGVSLLRDFYYVQRA